MLLKQFGINEKCFKPEWISAAEGERFVRVVNSFIDGIRELGASPFCMNPTGDARDSVAVTEADDVRCFL